MQRTAPFDSVSIVEMIQDDGSRRGVRVHMDCATRKGLVQLSVPTQADPVREAFEIEHDRCPVCKRRLWKERDDYHGEGLQYAEATDEDAEEGGKGKEQRAREASVSAVQRAEVHGLGGTIVPGYRVKPVEVVAEQITGRNVNVSTRRGLITARDGDWVIHDSLGVAEVLSGEEFSKRYEQIPDEDVTPEVEPGTPDPFTPRDAPREDALGMPEHLRAYLGGEGTHREAVGEPGGQLTDAEAREAALHPEEVPVVGSSVDLPGERDPEDLRSGPPKNRGGRPPKNPQAR